MHRLARCCFSLALLLAVGACSSVDKALYQVGDSVSSVDRITGQRTLNVYDRARQIAQSNQATEQMIKQNYLDKGLKINADLDAKAYERVQRVFRRVHAVSHMKDEQWQVVLIPEDSFNAFVTGGTYVIVHQGLLTQVANDDELAVVMGHEIAHVAADHVYEMQSHQMGAALAGSKSVKKGSFQAAFTHENEEEADKVGLLYAALAGYNPEAASSLWQRMSEKGGLNGARYRTHPMTTERAQTNAKLAAIYKSYYMAGQINPNHAAILKSNPVFSYRENDAKAGEGGGILSLFESTATAFQNQYKAKAEAQRQGQQIAFVEYVRNHMKITEMKAQDGKIYTTFLYEGEYPLELVSLAAQLNNEVSYFRTQKPIAKGGRVFAAFAFEKTQAARKDINSVKLAIDHAEPLKQ